jgi:hypothetical protein
MIEISELTELIAAGWGHVRRDRIPEDWRTRTAPQENGKERRKPETLDEMRKDGRTAARRRATAAIADAVHGTPQETYLAQDRKVQAKRARLRNGSADWNRMTIEQRKEFIARRSQRIREGWAKSEARA